MKKALLSLLMGLFFTTISYAQENFENPIVIGQLDGTYECGVIYTDANNTCSFIDDVPNTHVSPDVVYQFALTNPGIVNMNLCNAATDYDTYLLLYNETFSQIAYDDDGCGSGGRSKIETTLAAGTYYIVIEGYSTRCGNYHLEVSYNAPLTPSVLNLPDLTGSCSIASASAPEASSYCAATIIGTTETVFPILSSTVITWTYDDGFGGITTQTQNAIITDNTPPIPELASLPDIVEECEITALTEPTATDNCGNVGVTHDAVLPIYSSTTITWTYTDSNGNSSTQTQNLVINDATPPVPDFALLPDITVECEVASLTPPTATDNCAGEIIGVHDASLPITAQGTTLVTWTYTDNNGNSVTQAQNVIVADITPPSMTCSADITTNTDIGLCGATVTYELPVVTDNCNIYDTNLIINGDASDGLNNWTITESGGSGWEAAQGSFKTSSGWCRKYQVVDLLVAGYTEFMLDLSPEIFVSDDYQSDYNANDPYYLKLELRNASNEVIASFDSGTLLTSNDWQTISHTFAGYGEGLRYIYFEHGGKDEQYWGGFFGARMTNATVKVEILPTINQTAGLPSNSVFTVGTTTNIFESTDALGNTSTCSFNVVVTDNEAPVPTLESLPDVEAECEVTTLTVPTATDNCDGEIVGTHDATLPITTQGTTVVTWTFTDNNENSVTQTQNVIIDDVTPPTIICQADITTNTDMGLYGAIVTHNLPTVTDNCDMYGANLIINGDASDGLNNWTITENGGNGWNASNGQFNTSHSWARKHQIIDLLAVGYSESQLDQSPDIFISDNYSGNAFDPLDFYQIKTELRNASNEVIESFDSGVITCSSDWQTFSHTFSEYGEGVRYIYFEHGGKDVEGWGGYYGSIMTNATVKVEIPQTINQIAGLPSNSIFPVGTTTNTFEVTDGGGNTSTCSFDVIVINNNFEAPIPDLAILSDIEAECEVTHLVEPTATDNIDGEIIGVHDASLPITAQGTTVVTWTYTDSDENTISQTQNVIINDVTAPAPDITDLADVTAECEVASLTEPTATDNCDGEIVGTHDATLPITTQGTTVVTWTFTDNSGNSVTQTQNVIIDDITPPIMVCPTNILANIDMGLGGAIVTYESPAATDNCVVYGTNLIINGDASDGLNNWTITASGGDGWNASDGQFSTSHSWSRKHQIIDLLAVGYSESQLDQSLDIFISEDYQSDYNATDPYYLKVQLRDASNEVIASFDSGTLLTSNDWQTISHSFTEYGEGLRYIYFEHGGKDVQGWWGHYGASMTNATVMVEITPTINQTAGLPSNSVFPAGTTTNTFEAIDILGNTSTCSFDVVVDDIEAPIPDLAILSDIEAECEVTHLVELTATDNIDGEIIGVHDASLPITAQGTTVVTWTYEDNKGNTTTQTQNVIIIDITPPIPDLSSLPDIEGDCEITALTEPSTTDNCGIVMVTHDAVLPIYSSTTITWTYTDSNGNSSTQTQNAIITDNTPPVPDLTTLPDIEDDCEITALTEPNVTDNCGTVMVTHDAVLPIYSSTTITWTYTDSNGNSSTQTQNAAINDDTPPVPDLATLPDIEEDCEITALIEPTATDNCAGEIIGTHDAVLPIYSSTTITWTYTDTNGNASTQTQNAVINDLTPPVPDLALLPDIEAECEVTSLITLTATDNCAGEIEGIHDATLPITTQGTTVVTWTFTDNNENSITQTQNIIIEDVIAPTIICPVDITTNTDIGLYGATVTYELPAVTDNCDMYGANLIINGDASDGLNNWTITASGGNGWEAAQGSFKTSHEWCRKYQVVDLLAAGYEASMLDLSPKIFVSEDYQSDYNANDPYYLKVQLRDASNEVIASFDSGTILTSNDWQTISHTFAGYGEGLRYIYFEHGGMDVQGWGGFFGARMTNAIVKLENAPLTINLTAGLSSNSFFPVGTTTNTFEAIDAVGNTSTCSFDVIVVNNNFEAPVPDLAILSDIEAECEVTYLVEPTATDNIDGEIIGVHNASLPITAQGTTVVTWTYTDSDDNTISQTQNVIINDITGPVADVGVLADITAECEVTSLTAPTATDNCGGLVIVTNDATLPITTQGTTLVTWAYEDSNGNTTTQTQNVVIEDITGPVADVGVLADITAECEVTSLSAPTAADNCDGLVIVTNDATLPITTQGTTIVTWTYEDNKGNTTTQTQNVVIDDVTAPVADIDELVEIEECFELTSLTEPSATDNCGGLVTVSHDATLPIIASTTITWTYEDGNGNSSIQTQSVVINTVDVSVTDNSPILVANAENATYQWVDCDNANNPIFGETNQTFVATENGNYAVEVTQNGCTATSDCINVINVDVNIENSELDVNVYPNPTLGLLFIEFSKAENTSWKLVNITGQVILEGENSDDKFSVNMKNLAPGVYILNIQQNNRIITKRVVRK